MLFGAAPGDPAAIVEARQTIRLGFIAALQRLPGRQRAVLILRDVLRWRAGEVADLLGTTTAAVNSALQRARAQLSQVAPIEDEITEPTDPDQRALLDRYAAAFENADLAASTGVLTDEVVWEMPPIPTWFAGRETVGRFLATRIVAVGDYRMIPTSVNGQPAFGSYARPRWRLPTARASGRDCHHHGHRADCRVPRRRSVPAVRTSASDRCRR